MSLACDQIQMLINCNEALVVTDAISKNKT